ncbi:MAG: PriCT-2 domain-containing protein [Cyanobacteria bacterium SZAS TMP-1]|nr:PriCT-2 domain-containing protein [Cyanobacteria bacterium SZAS TMP-1]
MMASTSINVQAIPDALAAREQWVLWRYEDRKGKKTKAPVQANGSFAKTNDKGTWTDFVTVIETLESDPAFNGAGYVFAGKDQFGLDLDHCLDPYTGEMAPWAAAIVQAFRHTYIEYSPSQTGLHIIGEGMPLATGARKWKDDDGQEVGLEIYDHRSPRYFTVTGNAMNQVQLANCQDALDDLYEQYFAQRDTMELPTDKGELDPQSVLDALAAISPDADYRDWVKVGMALKTGGFDLQVWEDWSSNSNKYRPGECGRKWKTFKGQAVTVGSIFFLSGKKPRYLAPAAATPYKSPEAPYKSPEEESDFTVREWPTLSDDALHGLTGDIVRASVESSEADAAAVLATFLVRAGATFGRHSWTKIGDDRHYPLVFGMVVGASAFARKGTSLAPVERIFDDAEQKIGALDLRVTNGLSSGEGLIAAVQDKAPGDDEEDADSFVDKRILVIESEFAGPLKAMQRQGNTLSVVIRDAWDRRKLSIMTKNNPLQATDAHIAILGHVTKDELIEQLQKVELSNGLVNRFLWFCSKRSKIMAFPEGLNEMVIPDLSSRLKAAILHAQKDRICDFNIEAADYYRQIYSELANQDVGGIVGSITARGPAQIRRLALIYCLLDCATVINLEHLKAAKAVWDYCLSSAKFVFSPSTSVGPSTMRLNDRILQMLERDGEMSQAEITKVLQRTAKSPQIAAVLADLQSIGRVTQRKGTSSGGRAPIYWRIVEVR